MLSIARNPPEIGIRHNSNSRLWGRWLRRHGYLVTHVRKCLLEVFRRKRPMTFREIQTLLSAEAGGPQVAYVTVYRNINLMLEAGLITRTRRTYGSGTPFMYTATF